MNQQLNRRLQSRRELELMATHDGSDGDLVPKWAANIGLEGSILGEYTYFHQE
jgi:hypothetical protein